MKHRYLFWELIKDKNQNKTILNSKTTSGGELELNANWKAETERERMNTHNTEGITGNFLDARRLCGFKDKGMVGSRAQEGLLSLVKT